MDGEHPDGRSTLSRDGQQLLEWPSGGFIQGFLPDGNESTFRMKAHEERSTVWSTKAECVWTFNCGHVDSDPYDPDAAWEPLSLWAIKFARLYIWAP